MLSRQNYYVFFGLLVCGNRDIGNLRITKRVSDGADVEFKVVSAFGGIFSLSEKVDEFGV